MNPGRTRAGEIARSATPTAGAAWAPAIRALWQREMVRFVRQRSRLFGAFAQPLVFWLLLGGGFNASFHPPGLPRSIGYAAYFYPGVIALVLLFTAIFATIAVVEDRQAGFLQGVLVAPVPRAAVVFGQALGSTTLAVGQGAVFLAFAPLVGIPLSAVAVTAVIFVEAVIAFALSNLGLVIAWRMDSTQGFHAIMNLILLPIWLLSGAVFPAEGSASILSWLMRLNPMTYGIAALRRCLHAADPQAVGQVPGLGLSLCVIALFGAFTFWGAVRTAGRKNG